MICKAEAGKPKVCKADTGKPGVYKALTGKPRICKTVTGKTEVCKAETGKPMTCKAEAGKPMVCKTVTGKPGVYKAESTAAAAPPPFRPGNPALCGSCPLVTPYYSRLRDLLCYNCMLYLSYHFVCLHVYFVFSLVVWVIFFCRFSFSTLILLVGSFDL